jgi:Peptidase C13 family
MIELPPSRSFFSDLFANQKAAFFMLLGSRRAFRFVTPNALQLVFMGIVAILANTLFSWLTADGEGHFNAQGLVSYLLWPFIAVIAGIFLAQRSGLGRLLLVPVILWLVADIDIALFQSLLQYLGMIDLLPDFILPWMNTLFLVLFIWQTVSVLWIFAKQLQWPWWERLLILLGTIVTLAIWQEAVRSQPIWKVEENVKPVLLSEEALYAQPRLLEDRLNQLQKGVFGETHWYFLGIAGAGYQDVFKTEIENTQRQFDTRFGTTGRSIALINNVHTQETAPIASRSSIARTLQRIGQDMNPDDVLFLFMTSHGNKNIFQLANDPISLTSIDPVWLRGALDRANIRWRVLVVSACFSGSFIPALESPNTIIITASSADRPSFGCSTESDYTYFGRAFFADAMRTQNSLAAAFKNAQAEILKREEQEGFPPSNPQMRIGNHIALILPLLESHLFPAAGSVASESVEVEKTEMSTLEKLSSIALPKIE